MEKQCLECGTAIRGRADKKFCSDQCRNQYNNTLNRDANNYVRNGGDGYVMFKEAENAYDFGPDIADIVAGYLTTYGPYSPYTDGRITVID